MRASIGRRARLVMLELAERTEADSKAGDALQYAETAFTLPYFEVRAQYREGAAQFAVFLDGLGLILTYQGRYDEAQRSHRRALEINRRLGDPFQEVYNLQVFALLLLSRTAARYDSETAHRRFAEAYRIAAANGDTGLMLTCLYELGLLVEGDDPAQAAVYLAYVAEHAAAPHWTARDAALQLGDLLPRFGDAEQDGLLNKARETSLAELTAAFEAFY